MREFFTCTHLQTCGAVGGGARPALQADWIAVGVAAIMPGIVVSVDAVTRAVGVVVIGRAVPLVANVEVDIASSASAVHVPVVVIVLAGVIVIGVAVVDDSVDAAVLIHDFVEQLVVVL